MKHALFLLSVSPKLAENWRFYDPNQLTMKNPVLLLWSPDSSVGATAQNGSPAAEKKPRVRAAFDRVVAAELSEALRIVIAARESPFAAILLDPYEVTAAFVDELELKTKEAQRKFGLAAGGDAGGKVSTAQKQRLEDVLDAAIRRIQTGARLTFPNSLPAQRRWGIGIRLEEAEDQVELLVPQILTQLKTETLRSIKAPQITALQTAFTAWMNAGGAQDTTKLGAQTDRAGGHALLKEIEPMVREIKTSIDGEFPYDAPVAPDTDIKTIRKRFGLPEEKPYVVIPRED